MIKRHFNLIAFAITCTLIMANQAFATGIFTPKQCPTAAQIQTKAAMQMTMNLSCDDKKNCNYNINEPIYTLDGWTRTAWYFFMDFNAASITEAKTTVETALAGLVFKSGPTLEVAHLHFCRYTTTDNIEAIAVYY